MQEKEARVNGLADSLDHPFQSKNPVIFNPIKLELHDYSAAVLYHVETTFPSVYLEELVESSCSINASRYLR